MPKCTINGQEVEVKEGATIIEAYKEMGQDIAHFCWHPGLSVAGVCRLCMVKIEGNPRLQIACNTAVQDGMVISNKDEDVAEAVRWGMDFHLINHPLDCPICDQAGECGLQNQYMEYGKYDPEMAERKVKKKKVVDLGSKIVLDSERCILCSRCVRFTKEVTKTNELGIFNRGDRSEIGTVEGKPLDNNYAVNTVDICPVGALTSKDFRFQQRVWYLKNAETICTGCSTGCNIKAYYNEEGFFRVKPVHNEDVNGYWMCDEGRDIYKYANRKGRLVKAQKYDGTTWAQMSAGKAAIDVASQLNGLNAEEVAVVLTGQYSSEEYSSVMDHLVKDKGVKQVYHWINNKEKFEDFDGLLLRGDRNPNTKGLLSSLSDHGLELPWSDLQSKLDSGSIKMVIVAAPENVAVYEDYDQTLEMLSKAGSVVWLSTSTQKSFDMIKTPAWFIPAKSFLEKDGTYVNYQGKAQSVKRVSTVVAGALSLSEASSLFVGKEVTVANPANSHTKTNFFVQESGQL